MQCVIGCAGRRSIDWKGRNSGGRNSPRSAPLQWPDPIGIWDYGDTVLNPATSRARRRSRIRSDWQHPRDQTYKAEYWSRGKVFFLGRRQRPVLALSGPLLIFTLPIRLKLRGGRVWLSDPTGRRDCAKPDPTLIAGLKAAHTLLRRGRSGPTRELDEALTVPTTVA